MKWRSAWNADDAGRLRDGASARRIAMPARRSDRGTRTSRRLVPVVEGLDHRELMAAGGIAHSLGPYVGPSQQGPRITQPAKVVNAHDSVQYLLGSILGPGLDTIESRGAAQGNS